MEAKEQGFAKLVLEVEIDNANAIHVYKRFGFATVLTTLFKRRERILGCPGYHKMLKQL
jgi:ribosomal protein S18 acetylase RimI-like enzyme